jgi:hypothetical protein
MKVKWRRSQGPGDGGRGTRPELDGPDAAGAVASGPYSLPFIVRRRSILDKVRMISAFDGCSDELPPVPICFAHAAGVGGPQCVPGGQSRSGAYPIISCKRVTV